MTTDQRFTVTEKGELGSATFSECRRYRYELWRGEEFGPYCMFLCLNPSTADQDANDPTVARCWKWAREWGFNRFLMTNLFAYRATDPKNMKAQAAPIGFENDEIIRERAKAAGRLICGWGNHGEHMNRARSVAGILRGMPMVKPLCFGKTKSGQPLHPLYLKQSTRVRSLWLS